jgi:hypothetical protein
MRLGGYVSYGRIQLIDIIIDKIKENDNKKWFSEDD